MAEILAQIRIYIYVGILILEISSLRIIVGQLNVMIKGKRKRKKKKKRNEKRKKKKKNMCASETKLVAVCEACFHFSTRVS